MYTFKLQTVLDHRQFIEDNLKKEFADIRQQAETARQELERLKGKAMNTAAVLKQEQAAGLSSAQVVAYHAYLNRLGDRLNRQASLIHEVEEKESQKQDELLEAMKRRQILEKLKDQGLDRYQSTMSQREMKFIDEIAVNQFVRKTIQNRGDEE
jgi:flagellar FliJ protein